MSSPFSLALMIAWQTFETSFNGVCTSRTDRVTRAAAWLLARRVRMPMSFLNMSIAQSVRWRERWSTVAARTACRRSVLRSRRCCALIRVPSAANSSKTLAGIRSINVVGRFRDRRKRMRSAILSRLTAAGDNAGVLAQARMVTLVPSRGSRSLSRSSFWPSEIPPAKAR